MILTYMNPNKTAFEQIGYMWIKNRICVVVDS